MTSSDRFNLERFVTAQAPLFRECARRIASRSEANPLDVVRLSSAERSRSIINGSVLWHQLHR
jgi:uncharacterized protein (DUF1810 family)